MNAEELKKTLEKHQLWLNGQGGERANLSGADLSEANLIGANLSDAYLIGANLRGANLSRVNLSGANLRIANLSGADLSNANLRGADLSGADLSNANLIGADLSGADLSGANLPSVSAETNLIEEIFYEVESQPSCLNMDTWHLCETTHCLAGWAVTLHPQGKLLESMIGPNAAGALIFNACCGEVPDFFSDEKTAVNWLRSKAKESK